MYSCLNPVRITNKITKRKLLVKCGKCEHCRGARSAELSERVSREMLHNMQLGGTCVFVTLTYSNKHLPLYVKDKGSNYWYSNRCKFDKKELLDMVDVYAEEHALSKRNARKHLFAELEAFEGDEAIKYLPLLSVDEYYQPAKYSKPAFGHLCVEDVQMFLKRLRNSFDYTWQRVKEALDNEQFIKTFCNREDFKFRYFACGEYGPVSMRPHYHLLLWFDRALDGKQQEYVSQKLRESWTLGNLLAETTYDDGIHNYLSGYVNGHLHVPRVLQNKSLKPFCTFSKSPAVGTYSFDAMEIETALYTGVVERDKRTSNVLPDTTPPLSNTYYRRYFPKCRGFGTEIFEAKLRVYEYVYEYFRSLGVTHTPEQADNLKLSDIDWSGFWDSRSLAVVRISENLEDYLAGNYEPLDYMDKYAALVCYRYCVRFETIPYVVLSGFERVYKALAMAQLREFYEAQQEVVSAEHNDSLFTVALWAITLGV